MEEKEQSLRKYLSEKVNPILEKLIVDLLLDTPEQIVLFKIKNNRLNTQ
jgi:hypothetical protein